MTQCQRLALATVCNQGGTDTGPLPLLSAVVSYSLLLYKLLQTDYDSFCAAVVRSSNSRSLSGLFLSLRSLLLMTSPAVARAVLSKFMCLPF